MLVVVFFVFFCFLSVSVMVVREKVRIEKYQTMSFFKLVEGCTGSSRKIGTIRGLA